LFWMRSDKPLDVSAFESLLTRVLPRFCGHFQEAR